MDKAYTLREESVQSITHYYISFTDSTGEFQDLEVSETLYFEFRQLERKTATYSNPTKGIKSITRSMRKR